MCVQLSICIKMVPHIRIYGICLYIWHIYLFQIGKTLAIYNISRNTINHTSKEHPSAPQSLIHTPTTKCRVTMTVELTGAAFH